MKKTDPKPKRLSFSTSVPPNLLGNLLVGKINLEIYCAQLLEVLQGQISYTAETSRFLLLIQES